MMRVFRVLLVGSNRDCVEVGPQPHRFVRRPPGKDPTSLVPLREAALLAFAQDSQLREYVPGASLTVLATHLSE